MVPLTDDAVAAACLDRFRLLAPQVWGFGWLAEALAVLLLSELEARPRAIGAVDDGVAGDLLRAAAPLLRDAGRRAATRRRLVSPELIDWWARWEALDPALRELAFAMPVEWLLALWPEAAGAPAPMSPTTTREGRR
jgi:hypothetical protein